MNPLHRRNRLVRRVIPLASIACLAAAPLAPADVPVRRDDSPARTLIELLVVIGATERPFDPIAEGELVPQLDGTILIRGEEIDDSGSTLAWEVKAPATFINDELARRAAASRRGRGAPVGTVAPPVMMAASQAQTIVFTMTATNNSGATQYFGASDKLATSTAGLTLYGGTVVGTLTDTSAFQTGASIQTPFDSMYKVWVDNVQVFTLIEDPYAVITLPGGTATIGPAAFGVPIPGEAGPTISSGVELELQCLLGTGATVTLTGVVCFQ